MDIDLLKSGPEDQIDMLMMMHMDKLSDFSGDSPFNDVVFQMSPFSPEESTSNLSTNPKNFPDFSQTTVNSPTFLTMPSSLSFPTSPPSARLNPAAESWRNDDRVLIQSPASWQGPNSMAAMREMIFKISAMQPIHIDPESVKPPKRRNVRISKDPQSVAARHRRERISERIRILQRLVPGGTKMDTASMLDEAIHYVKFLKNQVVSLERAAVNRPPPPAAGIGFPVAMCSGSYICGNAGKGTKCYKYLSAQNVDEYYKA